MSGGQVILPPDSVGPGFCGGTGSIQEVFSGCIDISSLARRNNWQEHKCLRN